MKTGKKKGVVNGYNLKARYSIDNGWSFVVGRKLRPVLTHREGRLIDACAARRGIKGFHSVGNVTIVGGIAFQ